MLIYSYHSKSNYLNYCDFKFFLNKINFCYERKKMKIFAVIIFIILFILYYVCVFILAGRLGEQIGKEIRRRK